MDRLDLEPRRAAPPGRVRRVERLHDDALVPGGDRGVERGLRGVRVLGDHAADPVRLRDDALERRAALGQRRVEQVLAVDVQDVEEQRGERDAAALARAEARGGDLEGLRPPVVAERDRLAVEHDRAGRQRAGELDHLRQPRGDVVERARVDRDVVAVAVDLDPRAVELPVDGGRRDLLQRGGDVRGGAGEHRRERAHDLERDRVEAGAAVGQRDRRHRGEVAVQHQRAAQRGRRDARGLRHRLRHHPGERALAQVAAEQPDQERALLRGRPREQVVHGGAPRADRARPGQPADRGERGLDVGHGQRRRTGERRRSPGRRGAAPSRPRSGAGSARRRAS